MLLALRIWLGEHLFGIIGNPSFPAGYRISPKRVVKWPCDEPEVEGHQFVITNTDLPVPRIYRTHKWRGHLAIEMEFLPRCTTLKQCWHELSERQREQIADQLSGYIQQLRSLEPPPARSGRVSATNGGACRDIRVGSVESFGPFENVSAFHCCLRGGVEPDAAQEIFGEKVADVHRRPYGIRFTHGDLGVQNILIRDGQIVAIVDWECSGWYPEYWEYTKAHYNSVLLPEILRSAPSAHSAIR
ncbi:uncharacterized protein RCC_04324 [Ramularia collo-cygni]|uniref:Aminoglycoside phosphotransferase domain-containing protein n=1 Tax=Ramularia collo-cygni TaxID=112498 RepID=A0A2D3VAB8_9PEZI|nr:uncharacterized protein RCC_04324 [Ramularia collo-cygni]CZT18479.1 uncharacterized protein RCC_04324 [Ramularia collo-cygni]